MWPESRMVINQSADWSSKDGEINISPDNIEVRNTKKVVFSKGLIDKDLKHTFCSVYKLQ
jgi:hypothetical protein